MSASALAQLFHESCDAGVRGVPRASDAGIVVRAMMDDRHCGLRRAA
jgi:hypothetical protein